MWVRRRAGIVAAVIIGAVAVGTTTAILFGETGDSGATPAGVGLLRAMLVVCAVALVAVGAAYAASGYAVQATGHVLAGIGLGAAAAFGAGPVVWLGVGVAGIGGALLVRDIVLRDPKRPPSA